MQQAMKPQTQSQSEPVYSAKVLRQYLKKFFPDTKFSVTTSRFAGGDEIRVKYVDGPMEREVEAIAYLFQSGHYDGDREIYNYTGCPIAGCSGAKYVFVERELSPEMEEKLLSALNGRAPRYGYTGDRLYHYHAHQIKEAELKLCNTTINEVKKRINERIKTILATTKKGGK